MKKLENASANILTRVNNAINAKKASSLIQPQTNVILSLCAKMRVEKKTAMDLVNAIKTLILAKLSVSVTLASLTMALINVENVLIPYLGTLNAIKGSGKFAITSTTAKNSPPKCLNTFMRLPKRKNPLFIKMMKDRVIGVICTDSMTQKLIKRQEYTNLNITSWSQRVMVFLECSMTLTPLEFM